MELSVDLLNGLLLMTAKAVVVLVVFRRSAEQSRELSAARIHCLLWAALAIVVLVPSAALLLPQWNLPLLPDNLSPWLSLPVAVRVDGVINYNAVIVGMLVVYFLVAVWRLSLLIIGIYQIKQVTRSSFAAGEVAQAMAAELATACGLRRSPAVVVSGAVACPQVWGWRAPVVILPRAYTSWPQARLRRVLAHEIAHVRRGDWPAKLTAQVIGSLLWFIPLIQSYINRCGFYAELACDDWVVKLCGSRADYARDLLAFSGRTGPSFAGAVALLHGADAFTRIQALLDSSRNRQQVSSGDYLCVLLLVVLISVPLASVRAVVLPQQNAAAPQPLYKLTLISKPASAPQAALPSEGMGPALGSRRPDLLPMSQQPRIPTYQPHMPIEELVVVSKRHVPASDLANALADQHDVSWTYHQLEPVTELRRASPVKVVMPRYPAAALRHRVQGQVTVEFDVDAQGGVFNPRIVHAEPAQVFDEAVIDAVSAFRFQPQRVDGQAITTTSLRKTFSFQMAE